jgi:uncharacterized protein YhbP (UPF0306 family)
MKPIPDTIKTFLSSNKVATVCFVDEHNNPYCINCFFVFDEEHNILIFKSSAGTTHQNFIKPMACVSGTILPDALDVLKIKGIQFVGKLVDKQEEESFKLNSKYLKKYPMSLAILGYIWAVKLDYVKFTDNTLGFGNKTIWKADKD